MAIHPLIVRSARQGWRWQWLRLMGGLGPADQGGHYRRPTSTPMQTLVLGEKELEERDSETKPQLRYSRTRGSMATAFEKAFTSTQISLL